MKQTTVIHGDNTFKSREKLGSVITQAKDLDHTIIRLEAAKLSLQDLEQALQASSLFAETETVILEGLHSLQTSQRKKDLTKMIVEYIGQNSPDAKYIVLWESRLLTKTMLKPFVTANSEIAEYKLGSALFTWLDSLSPVAQTKTRQLELLDQVKNQESEFAALSMLSRQIRLLLEIKTGEKPKVAPFILTKLNKQATPFSEEQLLKAHQELCKIDLSLKTSGSHLSLSQQLDLFVARL